MILVSKLFQHQLFLTCEVAFTDRFASAFSIEWGADYDLNDKSEKIDCCKDVHIFFVLQKPCAGLKPAQGLTNFPLFRRQRSLRLVAQRSRRSRQVVGRAKFLLPR